VTIWIDYCSPQVPCDCQGCNMLYGRRCYGGQSWQRSRGQRDFPQSTMWRSTKCTSRKVELPMARLSEAPMRVCTASSTCSSADCAGTKDPTCRHSLAIQLQDLHLGEDALLPKTGQYLSALQRECQSCIGHVGCECSSATAQTWAMMAMRAAWRM